MTHYSIVCFIVRRVIVLSFLETCFFTFTGYLVDIKYAKKNKKKEYMNLQTIEIQISRLNDIICFFFLFFFLSFKGKEKVKTHTNH